MSFTKRGLRYVIELNKGGLADSNDQARFDGGADKLDIRGIRSVASIQSVVGGDTAFGGSALLQLWGMKPSDMAQLSTLGFNMSRYNKNKITVYAYDIGGENNQVEVFTGGIFTARINYNAMPDVSLELECSATIGVQTQSVAGTSGPGAMDVATMLQGICAACDPPLTLVNTGVTAKLANPAHSGSAFDQINGICCAVGVPYKIQGDTLTIWPNGTNVDGVTVTTGPENGMVGYPEYTQMGLDVTMAFNPEVQPGRQLKILKSTAANDLPVPGVPGTFWINIAAHELSSEMPEGPWFTHASVSEIQIVGRN
jgi:hypothetical protein